MPDFGKEQVLALAQRMLDRGEPVDRVKSFVQRAKARLDANANDQASATQLSGLQKAAVFGERAINSAGFGVGGLIGDAVAAGLDPQKSFADVRSERTARNEQLGAGLGLTADLIGGLATGGATLSAIKNASNVGRLAKAGLAAADAGLQGGVMGATEGLKDVSAEGIGNALRSGAYGAVAGSVLGGTVGAGAGAGARFLASHRLGKELAAKGVNVAEAKALASRLADLPPQELAGAMSRIDDFVKLGKGAEVTAADVLGKEGGRTLRAATNASKKADALASQRLRTRDANIVPRARKDVGEAAGFTPEQMDTFENSLLADQRAKADVSFANARTEGKAFDAANPFTLQQKAVEPAPLFDQYGNQYASAQDVAPLLPEHELTQTALRDEIVQRKLSQLIADNPDLYRGANPAEWPVMHKVYTRINKEIGKLKKSGNDSGDYYDGLLTAKSKIGESLAARSESFRAANAEFADIAKGLEAYRAGGQAASASLPSKARALQNSVTAGKEELFRKGNVDRLAEQMGIGPNIELGEAARARQGVGQQAVATRNAGDKFRQTHGEEAYNDLIKRAQAEAQFAATSRAAQGNSTTAQQVADMGLLPLVADVVSGMSAGPASLATATGRGMTSGAMKDWMRKWQTQNATRIADALTRGGADNAKKVLSDIIEELNRRAAAAEIGARYGGRTRRAVGRLAAPND